MLPLLPPSVSTGGCTETSFIKKKQIIKVAQIIHKNNDAAQQQSNNHTYESGLHNHNNHHFPFYAITCSHAGMLELPQLLEYYAAV